MEKKLIFLLFFLYSLGTFAQSNIDIQQGEIVKSKKHAYLIASLSDGKGGLVMVEGYSPTATSTSADGYLVSYFDKNLELKAEKKIKIKDNYFRGGTIKDGKLYLFEFNYNKNKYNFDVLTASLENLDFQRNNLFSTTEKKKVISYFPKNPEYGGIGNFENVDGLAYNNVSFSENKKFFATVFSLGKEKMRILVHDMDFNKILDKEVVLEKPGWWFNEVKTRLGNDGSVFLMGNYMKNMGKANFRNRNQTLVKVNRDGIKELELTYQNYFLPSVDLLVQDGELYCVGFYSKLRGKSYKGIAMYKVDYESFSVENQVFTPFSESFLLEKYDDGVDDQFGWAKTYLLDNGDIVLNAERHSMRNFHSQDEGIYKMIGFYHEIVSFKINPKGQLYWENIVDKKQEYEYSSTHSPVSYFDLYQNGKNHYFFYGETKGKKDGEIKFGTGENLYMVTVDKNGDATHQELFSGDDSKMRYDIKNAEVYSDGSLIVLGRDGRKKQLTRIKPE